MRNILAIVVLMLATVDSQACSCVAQTVDEGLQSAEYVFLADVESATSQRSKDGDWLLIRFSDVVEKKGGPIPFDEVRTPLSSGACGKQMAIPEKYWFFTDKNGVFSRCSATMTFHEDEGNQLTRSVVDKLIQQKREQVKQLRNEGGDTPGE